MWTQLVVILGTLFVWFCYWQRNVAAYWQRRNIKYVQPLPVVGNMKDMAMMRKSMPDLLWRLYKSKACESLPFVGIFVLWHPAILVRDVDLIKKIMVRDFNFYVNRAIKLDPYHDHLGINNLLFVRGSEWRELRAKFTPLFTSGKLKQMYPLMEEACRDLETHLEGLTDGSVVEVRDIAAAFASELIATVAFGIKINSLEDPTNEFFVMGKNIFQQNWSRALNFCLILLAPRLAVLFRAKLFSNSVSDFLRASIREVMQERERSGIKRNDLIDILVAMRREAIDEPDKPHKARNFDYLVAQAAIFLLAGLETSSSTIAFALYEMAMHPAMQERLRSEILENFETPAAVTISMDRVQEMKYLGQVLDETLRKYPIICFLERECGPPPGTKGHQLTGELFVPAGTAMYISPLGIHYDERYWPNPTKFEPERFSAENRQHINWDAYMPFGTGPRNCIGLRLGLLQAKIGLIHFLRHHRVARCDRTPDVIEFDAKSIPLCQKGGLHLRIEHLK